VAAGSVGGSERRTGGRDAHRACDVSAPEEEHRLRVGPGKALEDRDGDRDCHASRISKSRRRQEAVHRSEEGSPEVVATCATTSRAACGNRRYRHESVINLAGRAKTLIYPPSFPGPSHEVVRSPATRATRGRLRRPWT